MARTRPQRDGIREACAGVEYILFGPGGYDQFSKDHESYLDKCMAERREYLAHSRPTPSDKHVLVPTSSPPRSSLVPSPAPRLSPAPTFVYHQTPKKRRRVTRATSNQGPHPLQGDGQDGDGVGCAWRTGSPTRSLQQAGGTKESTVAALAPPVAPRASPWARTWDSPPSDQPTTERRDVEIGSPGITDLPLFYPDDV
ncbi:unnamed protein product [Rhizoctonia solani]|uniref:Uncharacterized protein n=1 Tax=Rhizoctonia solani TaxID=456999 RepID=A0A8H3B0K0_9AGAM|nr:unnamed protein product [Rhizoctonia solani]